MKKVFFVLLTLILTACSGEIVEIERTSASSVDQQLDAALELEEFPEVSLDNLGPAPELENEIWLNTDGPLRLANLRGQVVLLDMWTFGWINCQRVIPSVREWFYKYSDQGLVVIGNHYPEFSFEEDLDNLKAALVRLNVPYPVAQDNDRQTWGAYRNRYWPTLYLIDKQGDIRYVHIGEGAYDETEAAIQTLLAEEYIEN